MIPVAASTSYASPKLFSMKAIRFPSGDHDARSPKWVSRVMFAGRLSSGLPGLVPCGNTPATVNASTRRVERMTRIPTDLRVRVKAAWPECAACYDRRLMRASIYVCAVLLLPFDSRVNARDQIRDQVRPQGSLTAPFDAPVNSPV